MPWFRRKVGVLCDAYILLLSCVMFLFLPPFRGRPTVLGPYTRVYLHDGRAVDVIGRRVARVLNY